MPYLNFNEAKPTVKLIIVLLSTVTIGIIVWFVGLLIARIIFSLDLNEVNQVIYGQTEYWSVWQLKYFQLIQSLGFFLLPGFFSLWLLSSPETPYFSIKKSPKLITVLLLTFAIFISFPFFSRIVEWNRNIELPGFSEGLKEKLIEFDQDYSDISSRLLVTKSWGNYLFNLLLIALVPAIGEELIFRGLLQKIFKEAFRNIHVSIVLTAVLFSAIHGQIFGFVPRFLLGVFFGYLMFWSGNIWLPVLAHFFNNAIAVTLYFILQEFTPLGLKILPEEYSYVLCIICMSIFAVVLFIIRKTTIAKV